MGRSCIKQRCSVPPQPRPPLARVLLAMLWGQKRTPGASSQRSGGSCLGLKNGPDSKRGMRSQERQSENSHIRGTSAENEAQSRQPGQTCTPHLMPFPTGHRTLENTTHLSPALSTRVFLPFLPNPCLDSTPSGKFALTLLQDGHSAHPHPGS